MLRYQFCCTNVNRSVRIESFNDKSLNETNHGESKGLANSRGAEVALKNCSFISQSMRQYSPHIQKERTDQSVPGSIGQHFLRILHAKEQ